MVDVSHANSSKQHQRQIAVAEDVAAQIAAGDRRITGIMVESHLNEGRQDILPGTPLQHGVSVTDACISMAQTVPVLQALAQSHGVRAYACDAADAASVANCNASSVAKRAPRRGPNRPSAVAANAAEDAAEGEPPDTEDQMTGRAPDFPDEEAEMPTKKPMRR